MDIFFYFIFGYLTCTLGLLMGGFLSVFTNRLSKKSESVLLAFTSGLLLAFVCFEMLPQAFAQNIFWGIFALVVGALAAMNLESTGMALALGLALHKLPEGFALGALMSVNFAAGLSLAIIIAVHCIPEALTLALVLKRLSISRGKIFIYLMTIGLSMAVGVEVGAAASHITPWFLTMSLGFAGGVMIYLSCGKILPESGSASNEKWAVASAVCGFAMGVRIISLL